MTWQCFWLEPTMEAEQGLRRYSRSTTGATFDCAGGYHNAIAWLDEREPVTLEEHKDGWKFWSYSNGDHHPHDDPRWPSKCADCDYVFTDDDEWQAWSEPIYRRIDNNELRVLHPTIIRSGVYEKIKSAEPGAIWDNFWYPRQWLNPDRPKDGLTPVVRCPYMDGRPGGHDWTIDHQSSSGGWWTRTGDPRKPETLTCSPSIAIGLPSDSGYYHGFLQQGVLTDHLG